jgi:hypothetical protein
MRRKAVRRAVNETVINVGFLVMLVADAGRWVDRLRTGSSIGTE